MKMSHLVRHQFAKAVILGFGRNAVAHPRVSVHNISVSDRGFGIMQHRELSAKLKGEKKQSVRKVRKE